MAAVGGVFTPMRGKARYLFELPASNDAVVAVLLKLPNLEAKETLRGHATLAALLGGSSDECDFTNYTRKVFSTGITSNFDTPADAATVLMSELQWTNAGSNSGGTNNNIGMLIFVYDPNVGTATDAQKLPLTYHEWVAVTDGTNLATTQLASSGPYIARAPA